MSDEHELPTLNSVSMADLAASSTSLSLGSWTSDNTAMPHIPAVPNDVEHIVRRHMHRTPGKVWDHDHLENEEEIEEEKEPMSSRRLVAVYIIDPNENIPVDKCSLHVGEPQVTDLTDEELFFELPVKEMLEKHNKNRVQVVDKDATRKAGRDVYLEPARIRDLAMTVVTLASF